MSGQFTRDAGDKVVSVTRSLAVRRRSQPSAADKALTVGDEYGKCMFDFPDTTE